MRRSSFSPLDSTGAALPPEEVRSCDVEAASYEDGRRVRLRIRLTPFQVCPDLGIVVVDDEGTEVASSSVVENIATELGLTLPLRRRALAGTSTARVNLDCPGREPVDRAEIVFRTPPREART
jgi:hypothetical protein